MTEDLRGRVFVRRGVLTEAQLEACLSEAKRAESAGRSTTLVEIIVAKGYATRSQLAAPVLAASTSLPVEVAEARKDAKRVLGKYTLVRELGRGGMAVVYQAWDEMLGQFVALKLLRSDDLGLGGEGDPKVQEFLREARTAVRLRHPNIVRVYELGRQGDRYFLSMEFIDGQTLLKMIHGDKERAGRSAFYEEPEKFVTVLRDVALALDYAHRQDPPIVHRDVKPHNILVDASGRACVVDFGLAKEMESKARLTMTGVAKGTPCYMSPEQARPSTSRVDGRTDVYALGAVLYESLTGRPPFTGSTSHEILAKVVNDEPVAPTTYLREHGGHAVPPADLERICLKALEKSVERRYATARAMADDLGRWLTGDRVQARAPAAHDRAARWLQRRKPLVGAVAAAVVMTIVALVALLSRRDPEKIVEKVVVTDDATLRLRETLGKVESIAGQMDYARAAAAYEELRGKLSDKGGQKMIEGRLEEIRLQELVLKGLVDRIQKEPREYATFVAAGESLTKVRVNDATLERIFLRYAGRAVDLPWGQVGVGTYLTLLRDYWRDISGEPALGLAIWCLRHGLKTDAVKLLTSLRGTPLDGVAQSHLVALGEPATLSAKPDPPPPPPPAAIPDRVDLLREKRERWLLLGVASFDGDVLLLGGSEFVLTYGDLVASEGQTLTVEFLPERRAVGEDAKFLVGFKDGDAWNGYARFNYHSGVLDIGGLGDPDSFRTGLAKPASLRILLEIRSEELRVTLGNRAYPGVRMRRALGNVAFASIGIPTRVTSVVLGRSPESTELKAVDLQELLRSARARLGTGDFTGAATDCTQILAVDPVHGAALVERGRAWTALRRYEDAIADLTQALERAPAWPLGLALRARARHGAKDDESAVSDCARALQGDATCAEALAVRARIRYDQGKLQAARADADGAIQLQSTTADVYLVRAMLRNGESDLSGAIEDMGVATRLESWQGNHVRTRCYLNLYAGRWADGANDARTALQVGAWDLSYVRLWLWMARSRFGQQAEATKELRVHLERADQAAWVNRLGLFLTGDLSEADLLQDAETKDETTTREQRCEAYYYAGMKAMGAGNRALARAHFARCRDTDVKGFVEHRGALYALEELRKQ